MKVFGTDMRRWVAGFVFVGFALRALTPAGYMPAPFDADGPFALCPNSNPGLSQLLSHTAGTTAHHHSVHIHNAQATPGSESDAPWETCKFGAASGAAAPLSEIQTDLSYAETPFLAVLPVSIIRPRPLRAVRVRGPPSVHL